MLMFMRTITGTMANLNIWVVFKVKFKELHHSDYSFIYQLKAIILKIDSGTSHYFSRRSPSTTRNSSREIQ
jgi:hypothetical protein